MLVECVLSFWLGGLVALVVSVWLLRHCNKDGLLYLFLLPAMTHQAGEREIVEEHARKLAFLRHFASVQLGALKYRYPSLEVDIESKTWECNGAVCGDGGAQGHEGLPPHPCSESDHTPCPTPNSGPSPTPPPTEQPPLPPVQLPPIPANLCSKPLPSPRAKHEKAVRSYSLNDAQATKEAPAHVVLKEGYLERRVQGKLGIRSSWATRYFVLTPFFLSVYKEKNRAECVTHIELSQCSLQISTANEFELFSPNKLSIYTTNPCVPSLPSISCGNLELSSSNLYKITQRAQTPAERDEWLAALSDALAMVSDNDNTGRKAAQPHSPIAHHRRRTSYESSVLFSPSQEEKPLRTSK